MPTPLTCQNPSSPACRGNAQNKAICTQPLGVPQPSVFGTAIANVTSFLMPFFCCRPRWSFWHSRAKIRVLGHHFFQTHARKLTEKLSVRMQSELPLVKAIICRRD